MEEAGKETKVNIIIGVVVVLAVIIMIVTEVGRVNKDNSISRKGTVTTGK